LKDLLISLTVMSLLLENTSFISRCQWKKKLADFSAQTYGVRAGGALITDKLFYFINYEDKITKRHSRLMLSHTGHLEVE
jgi:hypothetical protein